MELTRAQSARLGAFVLSGVSLLAVAAVVLLGVRIAESRDTYVVRFATSVSGLERGSQVRYQGLRVGRVESMRVHPDNPREIEVRLSLTSGTALYEGTEAVLALSGLTGMKTINLVPGELRDGRLVPGSQLPAGASLMEKLEDDAEIIAAKVARVADQLADWTAPPNRRRVEILIDRASSLMNTVEILIEEGQPAFLEALGTLSTSLEAAETLARTSEHILRDNRVGLRRGISALATSLEHVQRMLRSISPSDVRQTLLAARNAMEAVDHRFSDAELGRLVDDLRHGLRSVVRLIGELDLAVRASREDFVLALKRVREASEDLREFSRLIAQDPSVLVRGTELGE